MMNEHENLEINAIELNDEMLEGVSGGKGITLKCKVAEANVRSGPGKDFSVIGHLRRNEKVNFKGEQRKDKEGKTWLCVNIGLKYGWIRKDMVTL